MSFFQMRWQRLSSRQRHVTIGMVSAFLLYSLLGFVALPQVARPVAENFLNEQLRYPCEIGSVRFNPFTLHLEVSDLYVGALDDAVLSWELLEVDLSWSTLWRGAIQIERLRLVKPQVIGGLDHTGQPILIGLVEALQEEGKVAQPAQPLTEEGAAAVEAESVAASPVAAKADTSTAEVSKIEAGIADTAADALETSAEAAQAEVTDVAQANASEVAELIGTAEGIAQETAGAPSLEADVQGGSEELVSAEGAAVAPKEEATSGMLALDLARFELVEGRAVFVDQRPSSPFRAEAEAISLALDDISTRPDQAGALELKIRFAQGAELQWRGSLQVEPIKAEGHIALLNVALPELGNYLEGRLQGVVSQGLLSVETDYSLEYQEGVGLDLANIHVALEAFELLRSEEGAALVSVPRLTLRGGTFSLAERTLSLGEIQGDDGAVRLTFDHQGNVDLVSLWHAPTQVPEREAGGDETPWQWQLPALKLSNWAVTATDLSRAPARWPLRHIDLEVSNLSPNAVEVPLSFTATLGDGRLSSTGQLNLTVPALALNVKTEKIDLTALNPYLAPIVTVQLQSGVLGSALDLAWQPTAGLALSGDLWVDQLLTALRSGERLAGWRRVLAKQLAFKQADNRLTVDALSIEGADAELTVNADGSLNYSGLLVELASSAPKEPVASAAQPAMAVEIAQVNLADSQFGFADKSMGQAFSIQVGQLQGSVKQLSTRPEQVASVNLSGRVARQAPVKISGKLSPIAPEQKTDLTVTFRHLPLTSFSPYSGQFAGYQIKRGRMNLDLRYRVSGGKLRGENKVLIEQLTLGDRVDSPDVVDLPIALGIALLKDASGTIYMDLPVKGDLSDPDFSYGGVLWGAVGNLLVKVVSSPFSALGAIFGDGGEQDWVAFNPAIEALSSENERMLDALGKALLERSGLNLKLTGVASDEDWQVIARRQLRQAAMLRYNQDAWLGFKISSLEEMDEEQYYEGLGKLYPSAVDETLTLDALEAACVAQYPIDKLALQQLAKVRAANVRAYLVEQAELPAERIFLQEVELLADQLPASVQLTLDAR